MIDQYDVKRLALVLALQAEIEGMKAFNAFRAANGEAPGYGESHFEGAAIQLRILAHCHNDQL
jgi:hypothetical protein